MSTEPRSIGVTCKEKTDYSLDRESLGITILGAFSMGMVAAWGTEAMQIAVLGTWVSILASLVMRQLKSSKSYLAEAERLLSAFGVSTKLIHHPDLVANFVEMSRSLEELAGQSDPLLIEFATKKLDSVTEQMQAMGRGELTFASTESWRMVYEQILRSDSVTSYCSVAWFKSEGYWQDEPGRKSLRLNLDLAAQGLKIQRIVIVKDELWTSDENLPVPTVMNWLKLQDGCGIKISVVKESALALESDLVCDMGVYDSRAVGIQELDERCRTLSFSLYFDDSDVQYALERWRKLSLFACPLRELPLSF